MRASILVSAIVLVCGGALGVPAVLSACTTVLVGKGLTADGSVIHAHNEDMGNEAVGRLWATPARSHSPGTTVTVPYLELAQAEATLGYWAAGNAEGAPGLGTSGEIRPYDSVLVGLNERGVSMSCNWAHSREENREGIGLRRYAIRQLLLERAQSARHGVELLGRFIEEHGQADWGGLIYHLADTEEAWVVETTTRNWVARRVRDDEIRVTANRFRIGTDFDLSSATLVRDAVDAGWLASAAEELDFSRVFGRPGRLDQPYDLDRERRAEGLLAAVAGAIAPEHLFTVLRDRYEDTPQYTVPQPGPVWREDLEKRPGVSRTIATNLAQSSFVAHLRGDQPVEIGAVMWFAMATPSYAGYFPLYAGGGDVPGEFDDPAQRDPARSAWWRFRRLQRTLDPAYESAYPTVRTVWGDWRAAVLASQARVEARARTLFLEGRRPAALEELSRFTFLQAQMVLAHASYLLEQGGAR